MAYMVEQYRKRNEEQIALKLWEAKELLCEVMEDLENKEDPEMERKSYRMSRRFKGRYDY